MADFWLSASTLTGMKGVTDESLLPRGEFAAVAAFWALLLLFGLRRPVERAWVLLPTALVILGVGAAFLWAALAGEFPFWRTAIAVPLALALSWLAFTEWTATRQGTGEP